MKKISFFTTLAIVVTMAFSSCIKDDDPIVNKYTDGSQYARNWDSNTNNPDNSANDTGIENNGDYLCYRNGENKALFYYDADGNVTKEIIYKYYETSTAAKEAFSELFGDTTKATDADGNEYQLNGTYIVKTLATDKIKFNTTELVYKFSGPQLLADF